MSVQPAPQRQNLLLPNAPRWPLDPDKSVIEVQDAHVSFADEHVLRGLNLQIVPGKTTVIVGRSGSGKSVLLKLMMGLIRPTKGHVKLFGEDVETIDPVKLLELRKRMSMLFQNYALFDALEVAQNVEFPLIENSELPRPEIRRRALELLATLGLDQSAHLLPSDLSGGMRKRVSLARALIANPEVVLFDEPTTGLDPIMIEKVDEMILLARKEFEITSVIISHDMASTRRLADYVAFLHDGKILTYGTYDQFMRSELGPVRDFIDGAQTSRLSPVTGGEVMASAQAAATETGEPVVELVGVHKRFGDKQVLKGVNLKLYPKRISVLIGGSGSGKSVIIKHVMGLFKADEGEVRVFGQDITPMNEHELEAVRRRVGLLFQHAALLDWLTVEENVAFPLLERRQLPRKQVRERVQDTLERLHVIDIRDRLPGAISSGQRKRVGLARAIITQPEIMIYDEPTTGQDPLRTRQVDDMIQEAQETFDITSIVISHDMASTFRIAHTIALLDQGRIAAYGTPDQVRASSDPYVRKFIYAGQVE
jgi:ABC-type transporter Mla maintaining outer membrane lipid asymmetry ATPase subunit MlaF